MNKNFEIKNGISLIAAVSALLYVLYLFVFPVEDRTPFNYLRIIPTIITVDVGLAFLFAKFLWKSKLFKTWLVKSPNLNGTWIGTIKSNWINPETDEPPDPIPAILTIKQDLLSISCVMRTAEMTSHSFASSFILEDENQIKRLSYSYNSRPGLAVRDRSPEHFGSILFDIIESPKTRLKGEYWTGRNTTGLIELKFWKKERLDYFPDELGAHPVSSTWVSNEK